MREFVFENGRKIVLHCSEGGEISDAGEVMVEMGEELGDTMKFADYVYHAAMSWKIGEGKLFKCILKLILNLILESSVKFEKRDFVKNNKKLKGNISDSDKETITPSDEVNAFEEEDVSSDYDDEIKFGTKIVVEPDIKEEHVSQENADFEDPDVSHIENYKSSFASCIMCQENFMTKEDMKRHLENVHGADVSKHQKEYKYPNQAKHCYLCSKTFCSSNSLNVHIATVHEKRRDFQCNKCNKKFTTNSHARKHLRRFHGEMLLTKTPKAPTIRESLTCKLCDITFTKIDDIVDHFCVNHPQSAELLPRSVRECGPLPWSRTTVWEKDDWTCPVCTAYPIYCESLQGLVSHMTQVHSDRSMCWVCGQHWPLAEVASLLAHMKEAHPFKSLMMCEVCGVYNQSMKNKKNHQRTIHFTPDSENLIHRCPDCPYTTEKAASLRKHKSARHRVSSRSIMCTECGKVLGSKTALKNHASVHNKGNRHKCEVCGKDFSQRGYLKIHLLSHTEMRPYVCEFCPMSFTGSAGLTSHRRRVHPEEINETPKYSCEQCERRFWLPGDLKRHTGIVHEGRKDFNCSRCNKNFTTKKSLQKHIKNVHGVLLV